MTLEGVLGPNNRLEEARGVPVEAPEAVSVGADGRLLFSSGAAVFALRKWGEAPQAFAQFERPVTALCSSPGGLVAVGTLGGALRVCDESGLTVKGWAAPELAAVADALFLSEDELAVVDHGYTADEPLLSVAPWDDAARGKLVALRRDGAPRVLAGGLHCPMGLARDGGGALIVTEFERARIVDSSGETRQAGYPGYLGRLRKTASGYLMTCLSRRDPLVEFLKTEKGFVDAMKATIPPRYWIGPRIHPEFSPDFPIELGATRLFGAIKPWAPSFSYGLVIELSDALMPVGSAHSRADGRRHAVSDAVVWNGDLVAVSKASGELLNLGPTGAPA
ncbi:hypothetical protein DFR50_1268 [Roseiarcus fermentans]|uniref:Strictosidine synthase n=1 Tax=Roseiarcus fermentans TaxID=1473586 RepID=A0A366F0I3_9HYPH|nr:hypothetical protein [Roseiarcus fermentans]RBP08163.1 hypothetical protein DFR50_1268 [Roseiarcus fermentans]